MARTFDGAASVIGPGTITAIDSGDWSMGAWFKATSAGETSTGTVLDVRTSAGVTVQRIRFVSSGLTMAAAQAFATTEAESRTSAAFSTGKWYCIVVTFRNSDLKTRIYFGDVAAVMAEAAYAQQPAGVGARTTAGARFRFGNDAASGRTWDGGLAQGFLIAREMTLAEAERFRTGDWLVLFAAPATKPTIFCPLDSPTNAQCEDQSGNAVAMTATSTAVLEDPPVAWGWPTAAVHVQRAAPITTSSRAKRRTNRDVFKSDVQDRSRW